MRLRVVIQVIGLLQVFTGLSLVLPLAVGLYFKEAAAAPILWSMLITVASGAALWLGNRGQGEIRVREGFGIVTLGWIMTTVTGTLPFMLSGCIPSFTDAFFEVMSGYTTTGASILKDVEALPRCLLFWRSLTHWLGGMGIIVLSIAILPFLGVGGMQLFKAEVPGPQMNRLKPRISQTAGLLWMVYVLMTVLQVLLLLLGGVGFLDAVNHSFATMATGGFSTYNLSVGHFQSAYVEYVITAFMFLAGMNFALHYRFLVKPDLRIYWRDREMVFYGLIVAGATATIFLNNGLARSEFGENVFRESLFQVVSIITTTGFCTTDFDAWPSLARMILLALMFVGGCAGSTGGGMKVIRLLMILKAGKVEMKKMLHPRAVFLVKVKRITVRPDVMLNVLGFFTLYIAIFLFSSFIMAMLGLDIISSMSSVAATLGNVGPGLGVVGPVLNYSDVPFLGKWVLSACMLVGRLEIYTVIILLLPEFWKKN